MDSLVSALLIAVIVIIALIGVIKLYGAGLIDKYLLSLHERNEEQRRSSKDEINAGVKDILNADREKLDLIIRQLKEQLKDGQQDVKSLRQQNAAITEQLKNTTDVTDRLRISTEGLRTLLSNNRLRGDWGEQVAEDLLLGAGFVENVNFLKQTSTKEGRPDFTVLLPDGTKLNIDAKFPLDDLVAYQEAQSQSQKKEAIKRFERAIRLKIEQITSKDYIDPEAQTVDFVVMFIPNEMVFSFIYEKLPDMTSYSNRKKVLMTGPFGFTAMLRLVLQAYRSFNYEQGLNEILGLIDKFQGEYERFGEVMEKVGRQLDSAQNAFRDAEGTRHRKLTEVVGKIGAYSAKQNGKLIGTGQEAPSERTLKDKPDTDE